MRLHNVEQNDNDLERKKWPWPNLDSWHLAGGTGPQWR